MQCFVFHLYNSPRLLSFSAPWVHQDGIQSKFSGKTLSRNFITHSLLAYEDAVPTRMILNSMLVLLLRIASRQAVITWFFGFPTRSRPAL